MPYPNLHKLVTDNFHKIHLAVILPRPDQPVQCLFRVVGLQDLQLTVVRALLLEDLKKAADM
jgi:hypothetical protein